MDPRHSAAALLLFLLLSLSSQSLSHSILQLPHRSQTTTITNELYCDSWRFSVETNDAGTWTQIPADCGGYVAAYMTGDRYGSDSALAAEYSLAFAKTAAVVGGGSDAWVFDIDETLLSNVPYYADHGFGCETIYTFACSPNKSRTLSESEKFDENSFDKWVDLANAPALPASLNLYNELQKLGFTVFLLTGRGEHQRNVTEKNLISSGYKNWKRLLLRSPSDIGKPAIVYKSEKRKELENEGYLIHGSSGDQWSDLNGFSVATRSFKLPNPMYYIA